MSQIFAEFQTVVTYIQQRVCIIGENCENIQLLVFKYVCVLGVGVPLKNVPGYICEKTRKSIFMC